MTEVAISTMQRQQGACAVGGKQVSTLREAARPNNVEIPVLVLEAVIQNSPKVRELPLCAGYIQFTPPDLISTHQHPGFLMDLAKEIGGGDRREGGE